MSDPSDLVGLLMFFLPQLPILLAYMVGLVLALLRWQRHPTVSLLAAAAFSLFLITSLVGTSLSYALPRWHRQQGGAVSDLGFYFAMVSVARGLAGGVGWILLLIALFGWRYPPTRVSVEGDLPEPQAPDDLPNTRVREGRSR